MKIGVRLGGCFATILVIMLGLCIFTVTRLAYINSKVDVITDDRWPKTVLLHDIDSSINIVARSVRNAIIYEDPAEVKKELARIPDESKKITERMDKLDKTIASTEGKALLKQINETRAHYSESLKELITLIETDKKKEASQLMVGKYRTVQTNYMDAVEKMIVLQGKLVLNARDDVEAAYKTTRNLSILFSSLAILLGAIFAYFVTRSITKPVAELVIINDRLAEGDLTVTINITSNDEIGLLAESSRKVVASMRDVLTRVSDTSSQVASASHQLQSTAEQIATGAEEVAAQTSTVATASEEMAATSSDIARNCSMAADSSKETSASATRGSAVVQETINGMIRIAERVKQSAKTVENLGARSEQIGQIVGTIEDIADQTNLLALNAAIEAARAGEQGRGFAVVADEVRALAERTTRATKEISDMIKTIQSETKAAVRAMEEGVDEVDKGTASSERSGQALEEILFQINEVTMQINQIATAAEEQTATTGEITSNVQQVTEVVHQTARGASETATASAQLSSNALLLQELVGRFKLA